MHIIQIRTSNKNSILLNLDRKLLHKLVLTIASKNKVCIVIFYLKPPVITKNVRIIIYRCPYGTIETVNCSTGKSRINQDCHCKPNCSVAANNADFEDPCVNTYKYLNITYMCVSTEGKI